MSRRLVPLLVALALAPGCRPAGGRSDGPVDGAKLYAEACARCHGAAGHGDTPEGRSVGAKDLTRPEARRKSDVEIRHQIVVGGGRMPAFGSLYSDEQLDALVAHVRGLKRD